MKHFEETRKLLSDSRLFYVIATGMDGNYSYVNRHFATDFAYISSNLVGVPYYVTMHPDDIKTCEEVCIKCFENPGNLYPATIRKHDGKGGFNYTQWEYIAMLDDENNPAGILCLGYNITEYVAEGMELRIANKKNEKNLEIIEKITFQQSHLIRSPLSNIIGLVNIIDRSTMDANNANICDMISESATQLDQVVTKIVTTARK